MEEDFFFYRNFNDAALNSMAYMGQFKDGYKMKSYDYPIITIPPKENMLLVFVLLGFLMQ